MHEWTHRRYLTALAWLEDQWNQPDRTDYYLMRVAQRVHVLAAKEGDRMDIKQELIHFPKREPVKHKPKPRTLEEEAAMARARWMASTGWREEDKPQARRK